MYDIAIFGAGGLGKEILQLILDINAVSMQFNIVGFFDDTCPVGMEINGFRIIGGIKDVNLLKKNIHIILAIGSPLSKEEVRNKITNPLVSFPFLVHPSVVIGTGVSIGIGTVICAGSILTTNIVVGQHVLLNLGCVVAHDAKIGDFSSLMPGTFVSGRVSLGEKVYCGTGAKIIDRRIVGDEAIIGAGSVVFTNVDRQTTVMGNPARVLCRKAE